VANSADQTVGLGLAFCRSVFQSSQGTPENNPARMCPIRNVLRPMHDLVIENACVIDGLGGRAMEGGVAMNGGRIAAVGKDLGSAKRA
jgi:hypothetical protein